MKIKKVAFGNTDEAFIESRFKDNLNIIFSNNNNRGKTLLMQGLMYSLGYESIFPSTFNSNLYYFYSKVEIEDKTYEFLRKKNSVIIKGEDIFQICNSISELKHFVDREILSLPRIIKDGKEKVVDLSLLYELFFLGQDKRNTSSLISKGQYNKEDFKNMLFSLKGIDVKEANKYDKRNLQELKTQLENKVKSLKKKLTILKANPKIADYSSKNIDTEKFDETKKIIAEINKNIFEFKKQRNREQSRKDKLQNLLHELNSLNRNIDTGKVRCADCGSDKIIFSNNDFDFEVSNSFVRNKIINSIKEDITIKEEIIEELTRNINNEQSQLTKELELIPPEAKDYILFKDEIVDNKQVDVDLYELKEEIKNIDRKLKLDNITVSIQKDSQKEFVQDILDKMTVLYHRIDKLGTSVFEDIFTKHDKTFSGSDEQEYYFSKMVALNNNLNHQFPIIIDSFRDGEISSSKEIEMLNIFTELDKQIILTATLKDEEYDGNKYESDDKTNILDYSSFQDSKILQKAYSEEFLKLLRIFDYLSEDETTNTNNV